MAETQTTGIIYPPPDIRGVIDTTAQFVAKHGPEFEQRVLREQSNTKFAFLQASNPYRAYFDHRVADFKAGRTEESKPEVPAAILEMKKKEEDKKAKKAQMKALTQGETAAELQPPPEDQYTVQHPFLAPLDMDIIKLTAQFVARNGQKFLVGLTQREARNPQFDFLKPSHALFGYFTALVDSYTKCLMPAKGEVEKLKRYASHNTAFLNACMRRYEWEKAESKKHEEKEKERAEEREQMAMIDWHEFVIVETIEFTAEDDTLALQAPRKLDQITGHIRQEGTPVPLAAVGVMERNRIIDEEEAMEIEMDMDAEDAPAAEEPMEVEEPEEKKDEAGDKDKPKPDKGLDEEEDALPMPDEDVSINVRQDYTRNYTKAKQKQAAAMTGLQKCPITGQMVPAEDMTQHLKILLLDPKWKKQKDQLLERARRESAFDDNVEANLASFVSKRPDLFGDIEEQIRQTAEMNAEAGAREAGADAGPAHKFAAGALANAPRNLELPAPEDDDGRDDDAHLAQAGMMALPPIMGERPDMTPFAPEGGPQDEDDDEDGEPDAKRRKVEDFEPEDAFLARVGTTEVKLIVQVLSGEARGAQTLTLDAPYATRVGELKGKMQAMGCAIPITRMRLVHQEKRFLLKDSNTLAFYNLASGTVLEAKLQERGGRKK